MSRQKKGISSFFFFYFAFVGLFSPYLSLWLNFRGFSPTEIGVLLSPMQWSRIIGPPFWGFLSDSQTARFSLNRILMLASMVALFISLFLSGASGFGQTITILIFLTFFLSGLVPLVEVVALSTSVEAKCKYGDLRVWGSIGFLFAVLSFGFLIQEMGVETIPIFIIVSLFFIFISTILLRGEKKPKNLSEKISIRKLFSRNVCIFLVASTTMLFAHSVLYTFYSLWLKAYGYSKIEIGVFWAIGVFAEIIFFLNQNRIFSIITNLTFVWFLCFLVAVGRFLLIYFSEGAVTLLVFAQLLHAVTFGLHHTCSILLIGELFPSSAKAIGQSSYTAAAYGIGGSLGGVFSGLVWEKFNADSIFLLAVFAALAGCFVSWRLYRNFNMEFKEL